MDRADLIEAFREHVAADHAHDLVGVEDAVGLSKQVDLPGKAVQFLPLRGLS